MPCFFGWGGGIFACATYPINCPQDSLVLRTNCRWQFSPYSNPSTLQYKPKGSTEMVLPSVRGWGGGIFACATYPQNSPQDSLVLRTNCRWQFSPYSNPSTLQYKPKAAPKWCCLLFVAGVEGFEPPNNGVRVRGLTAWRHPKILFLLFYQNCREITSVFNGFIKGLLSFLFFCIL